MIWINGIGVREGKWQGNTKCNCKVIYKRVDLSIMYFLMVLGQLLPRKIAPSPNSNSNPKPNPNPKRGKIFLGGNCTDTLFDVYQGRTSKPIIKIMISNF